METEAAIIGGKHSRCVVNSRPHLEILTWLRGIAALLVIVSHSVRVGHGKYSPEDMPAHLLIFEFFDLGDFAVELFFALSGCTLYFSNQQIRSPIEVIAFYIKRFMRIWPAFIVSLLCYIVLSQVFSQYYGSPRGSWIEYLLKEWSIPDLVPYATLTFNIVGPGGLFNSAYWSLPVEFQYYLMFPIFLLSLRVSPIGLLAIGAILFVIGSMKMVGIADYRVFTLAYTFAGGMLCGYLYAEENRKWPLSYSLAMCMALVTVVSGIWNNVIPLPDMPLLSNKLNWYGVIAIAVVFVCLSTDVTSEQSLIKKILSRCGEISYSMYLYHNLFLAFFALIAIHIGLVGDAKLWFVFSMTLLGTWAASSISYRYVEKPFLEKGRKWAKTLKKAVG